MKTRTEIDEANDGSYLPMLMSDYQRAKDMQGKLRTGSDYGSGSSAGRSAGSAAARSASLGGSSMPSAPRALGAG